MEGEKKKVLLCQISLVPPDWGGGKGREGGKTLCSFISFIHRARRRERKEKKRGRRGRKRIILLSCAAGLGGNGKKKPFSLTSPIESANKDPISEGGKGKGRKEFFLPIYTSPVGACQEIKEEGGGGGRKKKKERERPHRDLEQEFGYSVVEIRCIRK